jgi:type I restriction enzyme M protein
LLALSRQSIDRLNGFTLDLSWSIKKCECGVKNGEVGVVGYEIPFNRHFYQYEPPRDLAEIDADLDVLSAEIMEMLRGVHS